MKNTKLSLKKETIEQLNNQTMHNIAGGNESANTACIANTGANCPGFAQSRVLCFTLPNVQWDCGGSLSCNVTSVCMPF